MNSYTIFENSFFGMGRGLLFQHPSYFRLHSGDNGIYFELCSQSETVACAHFTPVDDQGTWRSPARGTFAGISFSEDLKYKDLLAFYKAIEATLKSRGATRLEILPPPQAHGASGFANQIYLLRSVGFQITQCDLNHSLQVDNRNLSERMTYGNVKRLRKCQRDGLLARQLQMADLPKVYETLRLNRASKGHEMSMTLKQIEKMAETFPHDVFLFGCQHEDHLAAASLCLRLSPTVLYVFYWGDRPEYASYSPVVAVADAIYRFCQGEGFSILDVGTSTIDRVPNLGLVDFKRGLGFEESIKVRMQTTLL